MKITSEIRRDNLALLVKKAGGVPAFAEKIEKDDPTQVYQWLADPATTKSARNIGPVSANYITDKLGLPRGWLDHEHDLFSVSTTAVAANETLAGTIDPAILKLAMDVIQAIAEEQIGVDSAQFAGSARNIASAYNYIVRRGESVGKSNVVELRRGVREQLRTDLSSEGREPHAA